jgi:hypothetical protein
MAMRTVTGRSGKRVGPPQQRAERYRNPPAHCTVAARAVVDVADVNRRSLVGLGLDDLFPSVEPVRAHVVAAMNLARTRFDGQRRVGKEIVGAMHTPLGRRLLVLLDCHDLSFLALRPGID